MNPVGSLLQSSQPFTPSKAAPAPKSEAKEPFDTALNDREASSPTTDESARSPDDPAQLLRNGTDTAPLLNDSKGDSAQSDTGEDPSRSDDPSSETLSDEPPETIHDSSSIDQTSQPSNMPVSDHSTAQAPDNTPSSQANQSASQAVRQSPSSQGETHPDARTDARIPSKSPTQTSARSRETSPSPADTQHLPALQQHLTKTNSSDPEQGASTASSPSGQTNASLRINALTHDTGQHSSGEDTPRDDSPYRTPTQARTESSHPEASRTSPAFETQLLNNPARPVQPVQDGSAPTDLLRPNPSNPSHAAPGEVIPRDAAFTAGVTRGLAAVLNQKGGSLTMMLSPASLGSVRISMSINSGAVTLSMEAARPEAQEMLTRNLNALRATLEGKGLTVERMGVHLAQNASSDSSNSHNSQSNSRSDDNRTNANNHDAAGGESRGRRGHQQSEDHHHTHLYKEDPASAFERIRLALDAVA